MYSRPALPNIWAAPGAFVIPRVGSVVKEGLQATWEHLLETNNQHCVSHATRDHSPAEMKASGARGAIVVHIVDWNLGHSELVEHSLATGRVSVAITCNARVHFIVVHLCI